MTMHDSTGGIQHGGDHYKGMPIQPIDYAEENKLTATEFSVVKYVSRHRFKGGMDDLTKAFDFLQMLARRYYGTDVHVTYHNPAKDEEPITFPQHDIQSLLCSVLDDFGVRPSKVEVIPLDRESSGQYGDGETFNVYVRFNTSQAFKAIGYRNANSGWWQLDAFEWLPVKKGKPTKEEKYDPDEIEARLQQHGFFPTENPIDADDEEEDEDDQDKWVEEQKVTEAIEKMMPPLEGYSIGVPTLVRYAIATDHWTAAVLYIPKKAGSKRNPIRVNVVVQTWDASDKLTLIEWEIETACPMAMRRKMQEHLDKHNKKNEFESPRKKAEYYKFIEEVTHLGKTADSSHKGNAIKAMNTLKNLATEHGIPEATIEDTTRWQGVAKLIILKISEDVNA
jgi:hypothetical protein